MKIYVVENGNYVEGYYQHRENAEKAVEENITLIDKLKGKPYLDTKPCYITEIETND